MAKAESDPSLKDKILTGAIKLGGVGLVLTVLGATGLLGISVGLLGGGWGLKEITKKKRA